MCVCVCVCMCMREHHHKSDKRGWTKKESRTRVTARKNSEEAKTSEFAPADKAPSRLFMNTCVRKASERERARDKERERESILSERASERARERERARAREREHTACAKCVSTSWFKGQVVVAKNERGWGKEGGSARGNGRGRGRGRGSGRGRGRGRGRARVREGVGEEYMSKVGEEVGVSGGRCRDRWLWRGVSCSKGGGCHALVCGGVSR
jgi:hypothetical protein